MIVSGSDGVMSINGIYIAFVLNTDEWPWSLHICVFYPLNSGQLSLFDIYFKNILRHFIWILTVCQVIA